MRTRRRRKGSGGRSVDGERGKRTRDVRAELESREGGGGRAPAVDASKMRQGLGGGGEVSEPRYRIIPSLPINPYPVLT
eukprot:1588381-Rhodomonas_salina.1